MSTAIRRKEVISLTRVRFGQVGGAAVAGNIEVETGGSFDYQQKQEGGGPGYGLFQMEGGMHKAYETFLKTKSLTDSASSQIIFAKDEVDHGAHIGAGNAKKIRDAFKDGDIEKATTVFCTEFERPSVPHLDRRIAAAKSIFNEKD